MKVCKICNRELEDHKFELDPDMSDGLSDVCVDCKDSIAKQETKVCSKCGRELPRSNFYKSKVTKDGLESYCKRCKYEAKKLKDLSTRTSSEELSKFTARQLIDELRVRGYQGELKYTTTIKL